jgi:hypothetical protein
MTARWTKRQVHALSVNPDSGPQFPARVGVSWLNPTVSRIPWPPYATLRREKPASNLAQAPTEKESADSMAI